LECGREPMEFSQMRLQNENIIESISNAKEVESTETLSDQEDDFMSAVEPKIKMTRCGRLTKLPKRFL